MGITDINKKLIGSIMPVGESNTDEQRFENLREHCELTYNLIIEVIEVAKHKDRGEHSMNRAGKYAQQYLDEWKNILNNIKQ